MQSSWANAGVAPCYASGYFALTLKDEKGGIASVPVAAHFDLRQLKPGPPGAAAVEHSSARFVA